MKKLLSKSVLKQSIRNNWKLWLILTIVPCLVGTILATVPTSAEGPGFSGGLIAIYESVFFSGPAMIMMIIYSVTVGNKLVASEVDRGTMSFTLNTPITRKQIIFSKILFYVCSLIAMVLTIGLVTTIANLAMNTSLEYGKFWTMICGFGLFAFATSGICFFASCWFNRSGKSIAFGAGFTVGFFVLNTLSGIKNFEFLKYFTLNTLFNTSAIISGGMFAIQFIALFVIGVALYTVATMKFLRKDLPL